MAGSERGFMRRINAYVLAADPTWLEASVLAYYPFINELIVCYDRNGHGWTGASIPLEECLARLRSLDRDQKIRWLPGHFSEPRADPMDNDTLQRNVALALASESADWVIQLDTDEWVPEPASFLEGIARADRLGVSALEWPMRILFRQLPGGEMLEVCSADKEDHYEYIAPVAVRAHSRLRLARKTDGRFLRATVVEDKRSLQLKRGLLEGEVREAFLGPEQVIVHNSWARDAAQVRRKLGSWSHSSLRIWMYYGMRWLPAPLLWRGMRNLHPLSGTLWPALRKCECRLPSAELGADYRVADVLKVAGIDAQSEVESRFSK